MPLATNRVAGDTITAADINGIAAEVNGKAPATVPTASVRRTSSLPVPTASWTAVTFNAEDEDVNGYHDTTTSTERLTVPAGAGGLFLVLGVVSFPANATGSRFARILKNALTDAAQVSITALPNAGTFATRVAVSAIVRLAAGDWVAMQGYQNSGSSLDVGTPSGTVYETTLSITRLGA